MLKERSLGNGSGGKVFTLKAQGCKSNPQNPHHKKKKKKKKEQNGFHTLVSLIPHAGKAELNRSTDLGTLACWASSGPQ